jgi:hypothetical protein
MDGSVHYRADGIAGGTANVTGSYTGCSMYDNNPDFDCPCISNWMGNGSGAGSVTPSVSMGCSTLHVALGTGSPGAPQGTDTGSCMATVSPSGGSLTWSANVNTVALSPSGTSVTFTAANPSSTLGDTTIKATYTYNGASASASSSGITVHKPTALEVLGGAYQSGGQTFTVGNTGSYACPDAYGTTSNTYGSGTTSYTGYFYIRTYSVLDQLNPPNQFNSVGISQANITESFANFSSTCCNPSFPGPLTITSTLFDDHFALGNTCCLSGEPGCSQSGTQTITVNGYSVRTEGIAKTCSSVTLNP